MNIETTKDKDAFLQVLSELNAGVFLEQVTAAMKAVALGTVVHGDKGKKGKLTLTFDMARIGETTQLSVKHSLAYSQPTSRGKKGEDATTETPLYVGQTGVLTVLPNTNQSLPFGEKAEG